MFTIHSKFSFSVCPVFNSERPEWSWNWSDLVKSWERAASAMNAPKAPDFWDNALTHDQRIARRDAEARQARRDAEEARIALLTFWSSDIMIAWAPTPPLHDSIATNSKSLAWFPGAKFDSRTSEGVDIFKSADKVILSAWWKTVDFSKDFFDSKRELLLSQFAANNGVKTEVAPAPASRPAPAPRVAASRPAAAPAAKPTPNNRTEGTNLFADAKPENYKSTSQKLEEARRELWDMLAAQAVAQSRWISSEWMKWYNDIVQASQQKVSKLEQQIVEEKRDEQEKTRLATLEKDKWTLKWLIDQRHALRVEQLLATDARQKNNLWNRIQTFDQQINQFAGAKKITADVVASLEPKYNRQELLAKKDEIVRLRTDLASSEQQIRSITLSWSNLPNDMTRLTTQVAQIKRQLGEKTNEIYAVAWINKTTTTA